MAKQIELEENLPYFVSAQKLLLDLLFEPEKIESFYFDAYRF